MTDAPALEVLTNATTEPHPRRLRHFVYLLTITTAAATAAAAILQSEPLQSANDRSRWCTVWSLVERGSYRIDEIEQQPGWGTIDKVLHQGHIYSTKPPLLATLAAGIYWTIRELTGWNLLDRTAAVTRTVLLLINLLPMIASLVLFARMAERYARTSPGKIFLVIAAATGTLLTPFLTTFNNHTIAAGCVVFALYATMRIVVDGSRKPVHFLLAGFFAAFAAASDLPAALFGLTVFGLLATRDLRRTLAVFLPAAFVPLAAFFVTNYIATGGWKPFYMYYGTEKYVFVHEGVPSYWSEPRGIDANAESPLVYFLHCTIGHHGIFSLSPIFLLTLASWARTRNWKEHPLRPLLAAGLFLTVAVLGFYLTRTQNYNYGGHAAGLRWMFWLIPLWLVSMIPALDELEGCLGRRVFAAVLLFVSVFSAVSALQNPWRQPWLFGLMENWGWIDYDRREQPPPFDPPLTTWFRSLPEVRADGPPAWIEFAGVETHGRSPRLRLSDGGREYRDGRNVRTLRVHTTDYAGEWSLETYELDEAKFDAGRPPADFLLWPAGGDEADFRQRVRSFFRGLPWPCKYRPGVVTYLKTPLRRDAFRCRLAHGQVLYRRTEDDPYLRYRSDVWLCPEAPFGVLQVVTTVTDPITGEALLTRRYSAAAVSEIDSEVLSATAP